MELLFLCIQRRKHKHSFKSLNQDQDHMQWAQIQVLMPIKKKSIQKMSRAQTPVQNQIWALQLYNLTEAKNFDILDKGQIFDVDLEQSVQL